MPSLYDTEAPKKPTNLSINSDLLHKAKTMNINLSSTLEHALTRLLREAERDHWLLENRLAIRQYNESVETNGVFSDGLRGF